MQPFPNDKWSVQFSHSVVSNSLWLQRARLHCTSRTLRACSNSCPSSRWCYSAISSSFIPFSSCLQSFPALGSFLMSQFFASGGQNIGASALAPVLPMNIQDWFPLGWTGWISCSPRDSKKSSPAPQFKNVNTWHLGLTNDIMYIFICLLFLYILWCHVCVLIFCLFFKMGCFKCSWCILDTNSLSHMYCATFSPSLWLIFTFSYQWFSQRF